MPPAITSSGSRYRDLKERIVELTNQNADLKNKLALSICPYCQKVRGEAHAYIGGEEVACPQFTYFPNQVQGNQLGKTD